MKAEEKQIIYRLLAAAGSCAIGYTPDRFRTTPEFTTDPEPAHAGTDGCGQPESPPPSLDELTGRIGRCTKCRLARTRTNVVPGTGSMSPLVMVIGEGPGADEDRMGLPFVGKAGQLLDKMLASISLSRDTNCYIANIVKCRPPQNRDPLPDEQDACSPFLEAQIEILRPRMILCMGRIAAQRLLSTGEPVGKLRGSFRSYGGIPLLVTYHPSALLRNESLKRPAWDDLKMFRSRLLEISPGYVSGRAEAR